MTRRRSKSEGSKGKRSKGSDLHTVNRSSPEALKHFVVPLFVAVISFVAFLPALTADFVDFDDPQLFVDNTSIRHFRADDVKWMFTTQFMGHYQPLTWVSSAVDYQIGRRLAPRPGVPKTSPHPLPFHLNNLILHALSAVLFYFVALRLIAAALTRAASAGSLPRENAARRTARADATSQLRSRGPDAVALAASAASGAWLYLGAAVAALVFAIHPLRVESVAWATERRDVLSVFFLLLALVSYLRSVDYTRSPGASLAWRFGSILLLLLSLLSKAWGMSFVVVVVLLDVYPLQRLPANIRRWTEPAPRRVLAEKLPYLLFGVVAAVMAGIAQRQALGTMVTLEAWSVADRVVQFFYGLAFYVGKTIWPMRLAALYERPFDLNPFEPEYIIAIVGVLLVVAALIRWRRRFPAVVAASIFYVVTVAPVLGVFQSGPQFVADRYSYVSCMGWALLAGGALAMFWRDRPSGVARGIAGGAVCCVIVAFMIATWQQTKTWRDSTTLWKHAISAGQESAIAHNNLGKLRRAEGHVGEAIAHYERSVAIKPDSGRAWFNLANALKQGKKDYARAERAYREAVKYMAQKPKGYLNLGNLYFNQLNRRDDAMAAYRAAIDFIESSDSRGKVFNPKPYLALGIALRQRGEYAEARRVLEVARSARSTRDRAVKELAKLPPP